MSATARITLPKAIPGPSNVAGSSVLHSRKLNAMDCTMWAVDAAVRSDGSPGFNTQALLWLDGRIDVGTLTSAMQRLARRQPVLTACLRLRGWRQEPHWVFRPDAEIRLHEVDLAAGDRDTVMRHTSELLSKAFDLDNEVPVRFHLLHRKNAGDVLVVQYSHVLMDNPGVWGLLAELERMSGEHPVCAPNIDESTLLTQYIARHSRSERWHAAWKSTYVWLTKVRTRIALFGGEPKRREFPLPLRVVTRLIEPRDVAELTKRVMAACRFPGLSMALLASVFRAGSAVGLATPSGGCLSAGIGLELGLRTDGTPVLENLSSAVPLFVMPADLGSRQLLTQKLNGQLRERLRQRTDLGLITFSSLFQRRRGLMRLVTNKLMRSCHSVWYAYFGSSDGIGNRFMGLPIEDFCFFGPSWPAVGLTVIASQFRGTLQLHATYVPDCVSESRATAFMDYLVDDLRGWYRADSEAERGRFELPVPLRRLRFSRPVQ
jgi:hypothetical protein